MLTLRMPVAITDGFLSVSTPASRPSPAGQVGHSALRQAQRVQGDHVRVGGQVVEAHRLLVGIWLDGYVWRRRWRRWRGGAVVAVGVG